MNTSLILRPHHGLCIQHFIGKGYDDAFVHNMTRVIKKLDCDPNQLILLSCNTDALCASCPHNIEKQCADALKVLQYDTRCLALCRLENNTAISWANFKDLVLKNILIPHRLQEVCTGCEWLSVCACKEHKF